MKSVKHRHYIGEFGEKSDKTAEVQQSAKAAGNGSRGWIQDQGGLGFNQAAGVSEQILCRLDRLSLVTTLVDPKHEAIPMVDYIGGVSVEHRRNRKNIGEISAEAAEYRQKWKITGMSAEAAYYPRKQSRKRKRRETNQGRDGSIQTAGERINTLPSG